MEKAKKILFVDDEPIIVRIMKSRLKAAHYEVEIACNGKEAIDLAREKKPDVILMDIFMPGMDGYEVCRKLKEDSLTANIPVIMFTASQDDKFIEKGISAGAVDVINKPFVAEVLETMETLFKSKNKHDAA